MSHTVQIQAEIKDIECLKKAFNHFEWVVNEKGRIRTYATDPDREVIYDYVAVNPRGSFDLGVKRHNDEYKLFGDFFDTTISQQLGSNVDRLKQRYSFEVISKFTEENELEYEISTLPNGDLELTLP